jgi:hypothetical protein
VQQHLRAVEHHQQFGLIGVQPSEQPVEEDEAGSALEDPVETGMQRGRASALMCGLRYGSPEAAAVAEDWAADHRAANVTPGYFAEG